MKSVFIASTPNTQKDDLRISRKLLFQPSIWKQGTHEKEVQKKLSKSLDLKYIFTFDTGRASLYTLFKALNFRPDSEIILQAFTCLAVPLSIKWAQCRPVYTDIDPKTYNPKPTDVKKLITPKTRAVVVQHTFGIPAQIDEIKEIIDDKNKERTADTKIYMIEDLAHSLGSTHKDKQLGTYGDIAMLSFGQEKIISCTQGGALATNSDVIAKNLSKPYTDLQYTNSFTIFRNIIHPLLWNTINKTYYLPPKISIGKGLILLFRFLGLLKNQADPDKVNITKPLVHKLSNSQCKMLLNQLDKLEKYHDHRLKITGIYKHYLPKKYRMTIQKPLLRYPIVDKNRDSIILKLKSQRVIPGNWYSGPIHPPETNQQLFDYKEGSCPNAELISQQIINLPTSINTSIEQALHISSIL